MAEIFDQLIDEMIQAPPPKYSRAEMLERLMLVFSPVGPSETILVEDLASLRTSLQQAESRRESLFVAQQVTAARLYGISKARESADLETLWATDPGHFHQLMRQDALFLNKSVRLWRSLVSACEDPAGTVSTRLVAGLLKSNAQPGPAGELDSEARSLVRLALATQKNRDQFAGNLQKTVGADLPFADLAPNLPDPATARQQLLAFAQSQLHQAETSLAKAAQRQAIAQSHFSHCHHAGQDHLESLKLILTDIRQLQICHNKTLTTLASLQTRRQRDAQRDAERAADKARREAEKAKRDAEKAAEKAKIDTEKALEKALDRARREAEKLTAPTQPKPEPRPKPPSQDNSSNNHISIGTKPQPPETQPQANSSLLHTPDDAKAIEADLLSGRLQHPNADQIRLVIRHWTDHELFDHSYRFRATFR
ncbi:MAG: hypothetical protein ACKO5E_05600, partial [bacterium]